MQLLNTETRYGIVAQLFHWTVAALVLAQIPLGIYAARLPISIERLQWLSRHKAIGMTVLVLVLARLLWRLASRLPELPASMPPWERRVATATHRLLYLLLVAAPVAGWLYASAAGVPVSWFGLVEVPDLVAKNRQLADLFRITHIVLVFALTAVLALHVAGALRHAFIRRDGVVHRMLPWRQKAPADD